MAEGDYRLWDFRDYRGKKALKQKKNRVVNYCLLAGWEVLEEFSMWENTSLEINFCTDSVTTSSATLKCS